MMGLIPGILTALGLNKTVAYIIEIVVAALIVALAGAWAMHVHTKAAAYDTLLVEVRGLEKKYECPTRNVVERELATCLVARERDTENAQKVEIARQRQEAAVEQAKLDTEDAKAATWRRAIDTSIDAAAKADDGPVPKVLLDTWKQERKARGLQ